jgi:hypothetical protein
MVEFAGSTTNLITMDYSILKEVGIGIGALLILFWVVRIYAKGQETLVRGFLGELKDTREDFCKLTGNHIDHNTQATSALRNSIDKNTEVLNKLSKKIK